MIRAGDLKHTMAIEEASQTSDGLGGFVTTYSNVSGMSKVSFALWPLKVDEITAYKVVQATMTHRLRMWYRSGVAQKMRGIKSKPKTPCGITSWTNVDLDTYNEVGDISITASAANQYCTLPVANAPTTIGKRYRLYYDLANIVSTWKVRDFGGTQTLGTISANGTQSTLEFTAATAGGLRLVAVAANSSGDFDNFKLQEIRVFEFKDIRNMGEKDVALEIIVEEVTDQ